MKKYFLKVTSALLIVVVIAISWGVYEGGQHSSLEGTLLSDWNSFHLYGNFEYLSIYREYVLDKYDGSGGIYLKIHSYFTYYDEPYVFQASNDKNEAATFTIYVDSIVFGLATNTLIIYSILGGIRTATANKEGSKHLKKNVLRYSVVCLVLIALSAIQLYRINHPKWRAQDEVKREENYIEWERAREIVIAGNVATVFQGHSKIVSLILRDGVRYVTLEPSIDDIYDVIDECGDKCKEVVLWTE